MRFLVKRVLESGGEDVGAEEDPFFHFAPEAGLPGKFIDLFKAFGLFGADAVADPVEAGEVGGGFGGGDDVVDGDRVFEEVEVDGDDRCALRFEGGEAIVEVGADFGFEVFEEAPGDADFGVGEVCFQGVGFGREVEAGGIMGAGAADDFHGERGVGDGRGHGADLVERGAEGDEAVAGDSSVGRFKADGSGEAGGLADRTAGIGSCREEREAGADGGRGAARGAARDGLEVPRIECRKIGGVGVGGAHGEFVEVGFAEEERVFLFEKADCGCGERGLVIFQEFGGAGGRLALDVHVVFDGGRDGGEPAEGFVLGSLPVERFGLEEGPGAEDV